MSVQETWQEPVAKAIRNVVVLTYVLDYDNLLADASISLRIGSSAMPLVFGRASEKESLGLRSASELVIPDRWMSARHAILHRRGAADVLQDGGSKNGTYVNGVQLSGEQTLNDGDLIEVGHSLLCYRLLPETEAALLFGKDAPPQLGPTITRSPEAASVVRALEGVATSGDSVLLLGETGSGKEIAARVLHDLSKRSGAFHALNCGAIPEQLFESTFFGHTKGAFTGATEVRDGEIALCHRGTLFLDEVATMSPSNQTKLLRVLEDGAVTRLGSSKPKRFDVRWVSATNVDLFSEESSFREDLLRRLGSYVAHIPPLRRRREDLGTLSAHVLREGKIARASITAHAGRTFFTGDFPGNIRDLRTLRSAARLAGTEPIDLQHLPLCGSAGSGPSPEIRTSGTTRAVQSPASRRPLKSAPGIKTIEGALVSTGGNVVQAAQILGAHPRQVYRWILRFGLSLDRFRLPH